MVLVKNLKFLNSFFLGKKKKDLKSALHIYPKGLVHGFGENIESS